MGTAADIPGQLPNSSGRDQLLAASLMLLGLVVLIVSRKKVMALLRASWPITLYFSFCLVSVVWSDFPLWGLKRWVRALGDVIMVLIVCTDSQPIAAFKRLISRVGFVLLPASVLLVRYYPVLGSGWDPWGQNRVELGVTTNKNVLGNLVYLIVLGALWRILSLVRDKEQPNRGHRLVAQCTLLAFGIYLLRMAHCATANACFILGVGLMLAISRPFFRRQPAAVHALVLTLVLVGGVGYLLGAKSAVTEALDRQPDLTGRTEIWRILIPMVPNPVGGAGFETFWIGPRVALAYSQIGGLDAANEAHDGYIEVYLNLGLLGVGLIVVLLGQGYLKVVSAFRHDPALGGLLVAYLVTTITYNITEAGFRMLHLEWFFLLLSIMAASRIISLAENPSESVKMSPDPARKGAIVKTGLSRDAVVIRSQHREALATQVIVSGKRPRNSHEESNSPRLLGRTNKENS
jgi:O-antigen ligase